MKSESEKLKSRTSLSMNDADWKSVQKAAKISGLPLSAYLRETLAMDADKVIALDRVNRSTAKKERVG